MNHYTQLLTRTNDDPNSNSPLGLTLYHLKYLEGSRGHSPSLAFSLSVLFSSLNCWMVLKLVGSSILCLGVDLNSFIASQDGCQICSLATLSQENMRTLDHSTTSHSQLTLWQSFLWCQNLLHSNASEHNAIVYGLNCHGSCQPCERQRVCTPY